MRKIVWRFLLLLLAILFALTLVERTLSVLHRPVLRYVMGGLAYDLDPKILYKITPRCRPDINSSGYRDREFTEKTPDKKRILMIGDSFLISLNVQADQTIPKILETLLEPEYEAFNMGVYGYGPDQSYLSLLNDGIELNPDMVILELFPANDFNDLSKNNLFYLDVGERLRYNDNNLVVQSLPTCHLCVLLEKATTGHYFDSTAEKKLAVKLFRDTYDFDLLRNPDSALSKKKISLMKVILKQMRVALEERKITFAVILIPSFQVIQDPSEFETERIPVERRQTADDIAARICESENIQYLDLRKPFLAARGRSLYDPKDGHLTVIGNRYTAVLVKNFIRDLH